MKTSEKMLQDKLENQIFSLVIKGIEVRTIILHPKTWIDLIEELGGVDTRALIALDSNINYKGYRIFRSLDLDVGEFKLGL